jgi:hypothetical protein
MVLTRDEKQAIADELAACRDAQAATEQQLAAQREAGEALAAQKAQLAADLAAKQQALEAALLCCEAAEASLSACQLRSGQNSLGCSIVGGSHSVSIGDHLQINTVRFVAIRSGKGIMCMLTKCCLYFAYRHSCRRSRC